MSKYVRSGVTKGAASEKRKYHPAYKTWQNMVQRCTNPRVPGFKNYGGRGIKVCDRWASSAAFLADMMPTWFPGGTIDRIDNDGPYSPENCRWVALEENISRTRRTRFVEWNGQRLSVMQVSVQAGVPYSTLLRFVNRGVSVDDAVNQIQTRRNYCVFID